MRARLVFVALGALGMYVYERAHHAAHPAAAEPAAVAQTDAQPFAAVDGNTRFSCDSRQYCSQMHSCEEATWMLEHCPGMKMDGNNDGVPCEQQWCK
jgi:hypothetical protein